MQPPQSTGSFGNGQASPELLAAIQSRAGGNPGGPMAQTMTSAPTNNPTTQLPPTTPASASPTTQNLPGAGNGVGAIPQPKSEAQIIISALDSRLKSLSKVMEMGGST